MLFYLAKSEDEDTDDASETDRAKQEEATEIKEQMYREKLALIKQQESQLQAETMPEFTRKQKKLEQLYKERQKQIQAYHLFLLNKVSTRKHLKIYVSFVGYNFESTVFVDRG